MARGLARTNPLLNTILSIRETEEAEDQTVRMATTLVNKQMSDKKNNDSIRSMKSLNMKSRSIMMNRVNSHQQVKINNSNKKVAKESGYRSLSNNVAKQGSIGYRRDQKTSLERILGQNDCKKLFDTIERIKNTNQISIQNVSIP